MLKRTYEDQDCSVARALEVVGERWTLLIIRDMINGVHRFDDFLASMGIARNVLTERLGMLVAHGVVERVPYQDRPERFEYHLTGVGRELGLAVVSLMQWGDRHFAGPEGPPRVAMHPGCGGHVAVRFVCEKCGQEPHSVVAEGRPASAPGRSGGAERPRTRTATRR